MLKDHGNRLLVKDLDLDVDTKKRNREDVESDKDSEHDAVDLRR